MTESRFAIYISILAFFATAYQACIAEETLYDSERAYVFPHIDQCRIKSVVGTRLGMIVPISNGGDTPAYELRLWIDKDLFYQPFPEGDGLRLGIFNEPTVLFPKVDVNQTVFLDTLVDQHMLNQLDSKGGNVDPPSKFYVWGRIEYVTFNRHVFTQFCICGYHNEELPLDNPWQINPCPKGNDAK
jgi:hypothetical protein